MAVASLCCECGDAWFPALDDAGFGEDGFEFAELMQSGLAARDFGKAKVCDLSGGPLGSVMDFAVEDDACADARADADEDEVLFGLRGSAVAFALGGEVGVVFYKDEAAEGLAKHGAKGDGTPLVEGADGEDDAFGDVGDGRDANYRRNEAFQGFVQEFEEAAGLFADAGADGLGGGAFFWRGGVRCG